MWFLYTTYFIDAIILLFLFASKSFLSFAYFGQTLIVLLKLDLVILYIITGEDSKSVQINSYIV